MKPRVRISYPAGITVTPGWMILISKLSRENISSRAYTTHIQHNSTVHSFRKNIRFKLSAVLACNLPTRTALLTGCNWLNSSLVMTMADFDKVHNQYALLRNY